MSDPARGILRLCLGRAALSFFHLGPAGPMDIIVDLSDQVCKRFRGYRTLVQNKIGNRKFLSFVEDSFHQIIRHIAV